MPNNGYTQAVLDALKDGPKTSIELVRITGLTKLQVGEVIRSLRSDRIRSQPVRYELIPTNGGFTEEKKSCEIRAGQCL